jgi:glutathione-regulated potassium-efflux system ancillary protein KefC/glutathione-regulated potassium-efflux system protein KefB
MEGQDVLIQALVYLGAGVVTVAAAKKLGLGSVLGYLIAGAIIGPFALNLVGDPEDVMRFAEFGVVILLFLIGLEVRPALLWSMRRTIFGLGGAQVVATALAIGGVGMLLGLAWPTALAAGLVLAMSSTAIVLQTLDEKGLRQGPVGRAAFGVLLLQDLSIIPLFALLPLLATGPVTLTANTHSTSLVADLPAWLQALAVLAAVGAVVGGGRFVVRPVFRFIAQARLREIFTASALLIVVGVASLMQIVGLSPALGAFLAGVVLAESEFRRELETDIEPFRGLLLGLFFITVGASINFALILREPLLLIGLVLGLMTLKFLVMFALARIGGASNRLAATVAVALAQGGEFAFVLLTFTVGAGVIGAPLADLLTAVVAVSMAMTPLTVVVYEKILTTLDRRKAPIEGAADPTFEAVDAEPDIIIAGFGRFGQVTGRLLTANGFKSTVLDADIEQIDLLRRFGRRVHYGDATRLDLLRAAGAERARMLIVAIDDQEKAAELVERAREAFPNLTILARAFDRRHAYDLLANGADAVERETFEGALAMGVTALKSLGFRAHRALRAADYFRRHDSRTFEDLRPVWGQEEAYMLASRDAAQTMDRLLQADLARMKPGAADGWDTSGRDEELRETAEREDFA